MLLRLKIQTLHLGRCTLNVGREHNDLLDFGLFKLQLQQFLQQSLKIDPLEIVRRGNSVVKVESVHVTPHAWPATVGIYLKSLLSPPGEHLSTSLQFLEYLLR